MCIRMHMMDHSPIVMSLLGVQETRNRPGLQDITAIGEKMSCGEPVENEYNATLHFTVLYLTLIWKVANFKKQDLGCTVHS